MGYNDRYKPVAGLCQYEYWDKKQKKIVHCPEMGKKISIAGRPTVYCCAEHGAFYIDCWNRADIEIYKEHKKEKQKKIKQFVLSLEANE